VHNSLIMAIRDVLAPVLAPRYYIATEGRVYRVEPDELRLVGIPILVSRGARRPHAQLYAFNLRQPIPPFPLPLLPGDDEPSVDLNAILHALYDRARFDLRLNYAQPSLPPLSEADAAWARELIQNAA
jgi:hypothetical protein